MQNKDIYEKLEVYSEVKKKIYDVSNTAYNISEVFKYKPTYNWISNPVGQIVKIGDREEILHGFCSGFNIGDGYFLTAGHCLSSDNVCYIFDSSVNLDSLRISFNHEFSIIGHGQIISKREIKNELLPIRVVDHGSCNVSFGTAVDSNKPSDYAVFKLDPRAAQYGELKIDTALPNVKEDIVLAHHPAGTHKKISFGKIKSVKKEMVNHTAFTLGGSSGCPVALKSNRNVVAVHVAGSVDNIKLPDQKEHYGITIEEIVKVAHKNKKAWINSFNFFGNSNNDRLNVNHGGNQNHQPTNNSNCC